MKNVPKVISLTEIKNETTIYAKIILPINNQLESWGDFETRTAILSLQQPVIAPLYSSRQKEAVLLNWLSDKPEQFDEAFYHQYLMNRWEKEVYPKSGSTLEFKNYWFAALNDGVVEVKEEAPKCGSFNLESFTKIENNKPSSGFTVVLGPSFYMMDGRFAGNGWLQEVPHPITKVTWDNYAAIAPATAKELNLKLQRFG